ncbi:hypothetical protein INR49_023263 [Caranx melampygus]|nr:hypothetical protein INR49_023263 [Caranx melampygus]
MVCEGESLGLSGLVTPGMSGSLGGHFITSSVVLNRVPPGVVEYPGHVSSIGIAIRLTAGSPGSCGLTSR